MPELSQRTAGRKYDPDRPKKARKWARYHPRRETLQDVIGDHLKLYFAELVRAPLPDRLAGLIEQLAERERRH